MAFASHMQRNRAEKINSKKKYLCIFQNEPVKAEKQCSLKNLQLLLKKFL